MLKYRKIYYIVSGFLSVSSIIALIVFGLNFGIDFKGGTLAEIDFKDTRPSHEDIKEKLSPLNLGDIVIQDLGESGIILRFSATLSESDGKDAEHTATSSKDEVGSEKLVGNISEAKHREILTKLKELGELEEKRFDSIGPVIGEETKQSAIWATLLVMVAILAYIAWAFKGVSFPLKSWKYGIISIVTLTHNILVTVGIFIVVGEFVNAEVSVTFVAAILTILGYSINDTIVIFDRIRENVLREGSVFDFGKVIDKSISQTFVRSLGTGLCTLFALFSIYLFGGETLKLFVFVLITGIIVGTYSSIFVASPLLFSWYMLERKK